MTFDVVAAAFAAATDPVQVLTGFDRYLKKLHLNCYHHGSEMSKDAVFDFAAVQAKIEESSAVSHSSWKVNVHSTNLPRELIEVAAAAAAVVVVVPTRPNQRH